MQICFENELSLYTCNFEKKKLLFSICYCSLQSGCFLVERTKHEDKTSWNVSFRTGREWIAARYLNTAFSVTVHVNLICPTFSFLVCYYVPCTCTRTATHSTCLMRSYRACSEVKSPLVHCTRTIHVLYDSSFEYAPFLFFIFSCFTSNAQDITKAKVSILSFHISICMYVCVFCASHVCPSVRTVLCCCLHFVPVKAIVLLVHRYRWNYECVFLFLFLFQRFR